MTTTRRTGRAPVRSRTWPRAFVPLLVVCVAGAASCREDSAPSQGAENAPDQMVPRPVPDRSDTSAIVDPDTAATGRAGDERASDAGEGEGEGEDQSEGWSQLPLRGTPDGSRRGVAVLTGVRTGRHQGYDRVVFEFTNHIPEYTIRFVQDAIACGSGERVDPGGAAALEVDLRPAAAHDDAGNATVEARVLRPGLPALRTARITCDFEAIVTWVLGLDHRAAVRTLELASPPRLVVDVRHR